ncbi:MAG: alpha/beta hydrolase [Chitinophagaceae bacterium]|nr:MAG: alpha/beta hydrolase [Chitinophagaceae bacterium]
MNLQVLLATLFTCASIAATAQRSGSSDIPFQGGSVHVTHNSHAFEGDHYTPVFFLHGGFQDASMWRQNTPILQPPFAAFYIDLPGHGNSVSGPRPPDADSVILAVLDYFNKGKVDLVGLSFGSAVALEFATKHPERVRRLVLAAPGMAGWEEVASIDSSTIAAFQNMGAALEREDTAEAARQFVQSWYVGPYKKKSDVPKDLYNYGYSTTLRNMRAHRATGWPEFSKPQTVHRLANVRMPVLLLVGTKDMVEVGRVSTYLKQHLPDAREVRFPGAAHMLNLEQPEFFNKTVRAFLSKP